MEKRFNLLQSKKSKSRNQSPVEIVEYTSVMANREFKYGAEEEDDGSTSSSSSSESSSSASVSVEEVIISSSSSSSEEDMFVPIPPKKGDTNVPSSKDKVGNEGYGKRKTSSKNNDKHLARKQSTADFRKYEKVPTKDSKQDGDGITKTQSIPKTDVVKEEKGPRLNLIKVKRTKLEPGLSIKSPRSRLGLYYRGRRTEKGKLVKALNDAFQNSD